MKYAWPAILQILAFGVAFAEVMIPSFGLLTLLCAGLGIYSWYYIITVLPNGAAIGFGIADIILIPMAVKIGFTYLGHSPVSHITNLGTGGGMEARDQEMTKLIGQTALVDAPLRPSGKVRIGDEVYEAKTTGDFVERNAQVRITGLASAALLVEKI